MSLLALEVADAGLLAVGEPGPAAGEVAPSPGYALLEGSSLHLGLEALARGRRRPRWLHGRFWHRLDQEPAGHPYPAELTHAELVHAHLESFWKPLAAGVESVVLALPGDLAPTQLALLLGIARAAGLPVEGLVDLAVAAGAAALAGEAGELPPEPGAGEKLLHLDLHLHRLVATELAFERTGETTGILERRRVESSPEVGLATLHDLWARRIAELFIAETRFDPLHGARSEEELYRRLPGWLEALARHQAVRATLGAGSRELAIDLQRGELLTASEAAYGEVITLLRRLAPVGEKAVVLLGHRLAVLPGVRERVAGARGLRPVALAPAAAARGALAAAAEVRAPGRALPLVTRLERLALPAAPAPPPSGTPASPRSRRPTHLLHAGTAHAITREPLVVGISVGDTGAGPGRRLALRGEVAGVSRRHLAVYLEDGQAIAESLGRRGTFLNGEPVAGRVELEVGDRLRLGEPGLELLAIEVVAEGDG